MLTSSRWLKTIDKDKKYNSSEKAGFYWTKSSADYSKFIPQFSWQSNCNHGINLK
jgi:hypothetical protein